QHDGPEPEESGCEEADRFRQCHGTLEGDDGAEEPEDHEDAVQIGQILCAHRSPDSEEEQGGVEAGEHGPSGGAEEGEAADHCAAFRTDFGVSVVPAEVPSVPAGASVEQPAVTAARAVPPWTCRRRGPEGRTGASL